MRFGIGVKFLVLGKRLEFYWESIRQYDVALLLICRAALFWGNRLVNMQLMDSGGVHVDAFLCLKTRIGKV